MPILALDVGTRTIGLARGERGNLHVTPHGVLRREGVRKDVAKLARMCTELGVDEIVVGLPYTEDGAEERSARLARQVGEALAEATGLVVHYQDERFSTVEATHRLRAAGVSARDQRGRIDAAAAAVILEDWLRAQE